jgi:hypothetical protein
MEVKPLSWPEWYVKPSWLGRVMMGMPFVGPDRRAYRLFRQEVQSRPKVCVEYWPKDDVLMRTRVAIDEILVREMRWPVALFLPEDPCDILFFDPLPLMDSARTFLAVGKQLGCDLSQVDLTKCNYLGLVRMLAGIVAGHCP